MRRVGVLGGSFDPLHLGHLWIALFAREQIPLDRVLLVPAGHPPHKPGGTAAPYEFRLEMARRAAAAWPGLEASDLEADPSRPSFTYQTLETLRARLGPGDELWLLLGADSLHEIASWREPERILRAASLAVYGRPGHAAPAAPSGATVRWIDGPACGLSSTLIRARLRDGRTVAGMVPDAILPLLEAAPYYHGGGRGPNHG